jgi:hypothetical protein
MINYLNIFGYISRLHVDKASIALQQSFVLEILGGILTHRTRK